MIATASPAAGAASTGSLLDRERAVVVVIDIQGRLVELMERPRMVLDGTSRLLRLAGIFDLPVIVTEQYPRGLGATHDEIEEVIRETDPEGRRVRRVVKDSFGCCGEPGFETAFRAARPDLEPAETQVVVAGMETHICVLQTVLELRSRGVDVHVCWGLHEFPRRRVRSPRVRTDGGSWRPDHEPRVGRLRTRARQEPPAVQGSQPALARRADCVRTAIRIALLGLAFSSATAAATDEDAVRATFAAYQQALIEGDGERAAALVDAETETYYQTLRRLVLEGSAEEVRSRSFVDRFLVVVFRHEFEAAELIEMELADVIVRAMDIGWINAETIRQLALGQVEVTGDEAVAEARTRASLEDPALASGMDGLSYRFVHEAGGWKFRFSALVESIDSVMRDFAERLGADEDDLIFTLVEALTGTEVLPEVWTATEQ